MPARNLITYLAIATLLGAACADGEPDAVPASTRAPVAAPPQPQLGDLVGERVEDPFGRGGPFTMMERDGAAGVSLVASSSYDAPESSSDRLALSATEAVAISGLSGQQILLRAWIDEFTSGDITPNAVVVYTWDPGSAVWVATMVLDDGDLSDAFADDPAYAAATASTAPVLVVELESFVAGVDTYTVAGSVAVLDYFQDYREVLAAEFECEVRSALRCGPLAVTRDASGRG